MPRRPRSKVRWVHCAISKPLQLATGARPDEEDEAAGREGYHFEFNLPPSANRIAMM